MGNMTNMERTAPRYARFRRRLSTRRALLVAVVILLALLLLGVISARPSVPTAPANPVSIKVSTPTIRVADFGHEQPSPDAFHLANWIADSQDNADAEFIIIDKKNATAYVFDAQAQLRGATPVLVGSARGDDSVPGIGMRPIADVRPEERTTPAGRFVAERGRNTLGEDVVWVDYVAAVSMHRVRVTNPGERRLERLATKTIDDNRISYGCINVPVAFYEAYIRPIFATRRAIVYVLPDVKSVRQVFNSYDVAIAAPRG